MKLEAICTDLRLEILGDIQGGGKRIIVVLGTL